MPRRYLQVDEIAAALRRGNAVECFIGPCGSSDGPGIRWLSLRASHDGICASVFEIRDEGSPSSLDIYEFGPLNAELQQGQAEERMMFPHLSECLASLSQRWPEVPTKMVNEGVVQDEYASFIEQCRRHA